MPKTRAKKVVVDERSPSEKWLASVKEMVRVRQEAMDRIVQMNQERVALGKKITELQESVNTLFEGLLTSETTGLGFEMCAAGAARTQLDLDDLIEQDNRLQREVADQGALLTFLKKTILHTPHPSDLESK